MELSQLEAFLAVVREGSFTRAATSINLTQPSLSARIYHLEQSLGGVLFNREKRPVQLTPLGEVFVDYAERAVNILGAGREAAREVQQGIAGRVTVCSPFSLATYLLPDVVNQFSQTYPKAELWIETGHSEYAVNQLTDGTVNLAFAAAFPRILNHQTQTLLRLHDEMVVAVQPTHDLVGMENISLRRLWDYQLLVIHWGIAFEAYLVSLQQSSGVVGPTVRVPLAVALPMVRQPRTITFIPRRLAVASELVVLDVPEFLFNWDVVLLSRAGRILTVLEQTFVDLVTAVWYHTDPDSASLLEE